MRRLTATIFLFALAGCSSGAMEATECQTADWRAIGYEDGARGYGPNYFGTRRKACAEHGIAANFDAYMAGRDQGLAYYCRPQNGYNVGIQGYRYSGVCPPALEGAFLSAHADGFGLYQRHAAMQNISKRLNYSRQRAQELEFIMADKSAQLVSPGLLAADRVAIGIELKQLTQEKIELEEAIPQLEADYSAARYEYEEYRARVAGRYAS